MLNLLFCVKCGILSQHLFNGSQEICSKCLTPYKFSDEEIKQELERRGYGNT